MLSTTIKLALSTTVTAATLGVGLAVVSPNAHTPVADAGCSGISGASSRAWTNNKCEGSNLLQTLSSKPNVPYVGSFFNDKFTSVEVGVKTRGWRGWKHANYEGCSVTYGPGNWTIGLFSGGCGTANDEISSTKLLPY